MPDQGSIRMSGPLARFVLQGGADARVAAGRAFGVELPEQPCRANVAGDRAALWLGPDEHLLLAPPAEAGAVERALTDALQGIPHSLVDVSWRQVAIAVSGGGAADLLNSGCPLDLDPGAFPPGACTRTLFAKADILLWRTGADEFRIETGRSFAPYVTELLRESLPDVLA